MYSAHNPAMYREDQGQCIQKCNMRLKNLETLLAASEHAGLYAKVNSLKNVIRKNKGDMPPDAYSTLDIMRVIFQTEITREIEQILDRHMRTTFSPAFENLTRNGYTVNEEVVKRLYVSILDHARSTYLPTVPPPQQQYHNNHNNRRNHHHHHHHEKENEVQIISEKIRGPEAGYYEQPAEPPTRKRKYEEAPRQMPTEPKPIAIQEVSRWNPERFCPTTSLIPAHIVSNAIAGQTPHTLFTSQPMLFRFSCDEHDRKMLADEGKIPRDLDRCYLMNLDDAREMIGNRPDLDGYSFRVSDPLLYKIRRYAQPIFERLQQRTLNTAQWQYQHHVTST